MLRHPKGLGKWGFDIALKSLVQYKPTLAPCGPPRADCVPGAWWKVPLPDSWPPAPKPTWNASPPSAPPPPDVSGQPSPITSRTGKWHRGTFSAGTHPFTSASPPLLPRRELVRFLILPSAAGCDPGKNKGDDLTPPTLIITSMPFSSAS